MKKIAQFFLTVFIFSFLVIGEVFAQTSNLETTISNEFGKNFEVTANRSVDIQLHYTTLIGDEYIQLRFLVKQVNPGLPALQYSLAYNGAPVVSNETFYTNQVTQQIGSERLLTESIDFENGVPAGIYTLSVRDINNPNAIYTAKTFTVTKKNQDSPNQLPPFVPAPEPETPTQNPPVTNPVNKDFVVSSISIKQNITSNTAEISGIVTAMKEIKTSALKVRFSEVADNGAVSYKDAGFLISPDYQTFIAYEPISFSFILSGLKDGKNYYFQIYDAGNNNTVIHGQPFSFKKNNSGNSGGVNTGGGVWGDGLLGNYSLPENIGEPDGGGVGLVEEDGNPLVPCGRRDQVGTEDENCGFYHLITLFQNIINYMIILLGVITVLACLVVGIQMVVNRKTPGELVKYKERFKRIGIGMAVMLLAFTIVSTLLGFFLNTEATQFLLLDIILGE